MAIEFLTIAKPALQENEESLKLNLIREIIYSGAEVEHYILRHKLTKEEALKIESVLIDFLTYPKFNTEQVLTNIVSGHHQWDEGIKTVDEISSIYDCEKIKVNPSERLLLVRQIELLMMRKFMEYIGERTSMKKRVSIGQ